MNKAIITVDLAYGDSGKGTVVDALTRKYKAGLNVRFNGGAQCGHNVVTDEGIHHEFAQFGSGTFAGAKTFLSKHVLVNPLDMQLEAETLIPKTRRNPLFDMFVDERALVTTPYHVAMNRIRELIRTKRNGSCGRGIRETVVYSQNYPKSTIFVKDLTHYPTLLSKLSIMKIMLQHEAATLIYNIDSLAFEALFQPLYDIFNQDVESLTRRMLLTSDWFTICSPERAQALINSEQVVIFEAAQGILLDQHYGFRPHITKSSCTDVNALDILNEIGFDGDVFRLGIARTYMTRHGAGPFPTEDKQLSETLKDTHNTYNDWQQSFRVGHLDIPAIRYAVECNNGIDGLAITHMDVVPPDGTWKAVIHYQRPDLSPYELRKHDGNRAIQEAVTRELMQIKPFGAYVNGSEVPGFMAGALGVPVKLISNGPAYKDKTFIGELDVRRQDTTRLGF